MPVDKTETLEIVCDNPNCPGNELDAGDRAGWLFVTHEVYGEPSSSSVYCGVACVASHTTAKASAGEAW